MSRTSKLQTSKVAMLGLVSFSMASGCASMKSPMNWFQRDTSMVADASEKTSFAQSISSTGKGITGQFKSMGTAVTSAVGKATTAVASTFTLDEPNSDPTSLANMPSDLGPEIWVANGQLYETQGNPNKALDNYTKALEKEPNNMAALLSTARLYAKQDQHDKAVDFFNRALALQADAGLQNELAVSLQKLGKINEAQLAVQRAIELDPTNARFRNNLASMLVSSGRSDEAVKQLEQVFPPAVANYNVAYLHFSNSNPAAAQQHLQLALQADPNLKPARDLLDRLSGSGGAQNAVAAYNTANQIYKTAQAVSNGGTVPAMQSPYQQSVPPQYAPPAGTPASTAAFSPSSLPSLPSVPAN